MGSGALRIAFLAQDFPPDLGGTHVYNLEFARRLAARGHELRVFTWAPRRADGAESVDAALPFPVHRQPWERRGGAIPPTGVAAALASWKPQVALVSGGCAAISRVVHEAARSVPVAVAVHDLRDKGRTHGRFGRWRVRRGYGYARATRIAANSQHTRERLLALGVAPQKVAVVHPGVDLAAFQPDPEAGARWRREQGLEDRRILLTVARLSGNKGHRAVIDALPRLREAVPEVCYAVVGAGPLRERLERRADELGVRELVRFTGRVPDARPWYHACDVYVMPSSPSGRGLKAGEGFGIAYVEAGACAKPVVASSSGGGAEIVVDGETGRVVAPDDAAGLLAALRELLLDPERARRLGQQGRERVRRYDWQHGVAELERVLREAARDGD